MHCSEPRCPAPATVLYTARGGAAEIRYRAAAACDQHRRKTRGWVARAGPTLTEQAVQPDPSTEPATLF